MPASTGAPHDVAFHFDPVCPWAWVTSRWVAEVERLAGLRVDWTFIALRLVNAHRDYERDFPPGYPKIHGRGLRLLRVAASVRQSDGPDPIGPLYTALGTRIHVERAASTLDEPAAIGALLSGIDLDPSHAAAADDESFDEILQACTDRALERTGKDVGTPIIVFAPPDGPAIFGPVISSAPKGAAAVELWGHVAALAANPDFAELKRQVRRAPVLD